jgi:putative DNA primase/helicase
MRFTPAAFRRRFGSSRGQTAEAVLPKEGEEGLPRFARTDAGNAELFAELYGNIARYVHQLNTWRVWTGKRWADDVKGRVEQLALMVARDRLRAAADLPDEYERREEVKWALRSESVDKRRDLLAAASTMPELACLPEDFDRDPMLLNCLNGVVDLRSGELRPHDSKLMQSKLLPVPYDPKATCPRWLRFLEEVFDGSQDLADFVRRAVGYSLTGDTREHALLLLHGSGCNGKTVFLRTLLRLLGDYGASTDFATLTVDRERQAGIRNDIARLHGARLVTASETSDGVRFGEGVLKQLTGGDRVTARFLHREFFEFTPSFKLWLACNHRPRVRDSSEAFWRRIRLIPFTVSFRGREDKGLADTLAAELPGILAWAVRGCLEWQEAGDLCAPAEVLAATEGYRADEDQVERFLAECCLCSPEATCGARELYQAYQEWAQQGGEYVETQKRFGGRLSEKGYLKGEHSLTRRAVYRGIGLVAEASSV